ncbi:MAG TPA: ATP-binding cassette domain-containing protein [bacterium]|nr:ATP-binding cassette domain-containing protein [bacterium]HOL47869.1 ATP-binding cassette domain-containing protein [bacterium]HPQ18504.1 ATP-binding cassette domain-containing protein [bacterium]
MIEIKDVVFSYKKEIKIFDKINLTIPEKKFVVIIGDNGSGKSTLAKLIAGIILPDNGAVFIDNFNTADSENLISIRKKIALIMPNPDWQLIGSTVREEIIIGLENLNITEKEINQRLEYIGNLLNIKHLLNRTTENLSGGEKQIVNLASVLILEPSYLILDEPISMLDRYNQKIVLNLLKNLKEKNLLTFILITHNISEILLSDFVIGLNAGKIKHNLINTIDFIEKNIYNEYNLNLNFFLTLKKELLKEGYILKNENLFL